MLVNWEPMRCLARATTRRKACRAPLRCSLTVLRSWSNASLRHMLRVVPQTLSCLMLAKAAERQLSPAFNLTFHGKNHDFCGASTEPKEAAMKRFVSTFVMAVLLGTCPGSDQQDRKSTRLNSSHMSISYAVFCLKKKKIPAGAAEPDGADQDHKH